MVGKGIIRKTMNSSNFDARAVINLIRKNKLVLLSIDNILNQPKKRSENIIQ